MSKFALLFILIGCPMIARTQDSHGAGAASWSELIKSMDHMHVAMATLRPSGDSDTDFVKLMLVHHQAAIDMAKIELMHGNDPQMRRMAQEVITDQQSEIEVMELWLKQQKYLPSK